MKNDIQKNFLNQMYEAEVKLKDKADRENKGIFTNKLFDLRFYGYKSEYRPPSKLVKAIIYIGFPIVVILALSTIFDFIEILK